MKKIILLSIVLAGCATEESIRWASSSELCYRLATGRTQFQTPDTYRRELALRKEDCSSYQTMIRNQMEADARNQANITQSLILLEAARPKPVMPSPSFGTRCQTRWINGVAYTNCD